MATTAVAKRRQQRQEELREKFQGLEYIRQISDAVQPVVDARYTGFDSDELAARKFVVDTNFRRLAKILPDLKSIEHDIGERFEQLILRDLTGTNESRTED